MNRSRGTALIGPVAALALLAACGDGPAEPNPPALHGIVLTPADSTLYVGATYALRVNGSTVAGNPQLEAVTFTAVGPAVGIEPGGILRGLQHGRATIIARAGDLVDSVHVSVVPPGMIAAWWLPAESGAPGKLMTFQTDGAAMTLMSLPESVCGQSAGVQWHPDGESIVFAVSTPEVACHDPRLYRAAPGQPTERIVQDASLVLGEWWPFYDAAGEWIYFAGRTGGQSGELWRVRADGDGAERLTAEADWFELDDYPSPSSDGTRILHGSNRWALQPASIHILDLQTRAVDDLAITGGAPRWSPQEDRIAYWLDDIYFVARSDGTEHRQLAPARFSGGFVDPPSWSPDGEWIMIVAPDPEAHAPLYGRLEVVHVSTGMNLPLAWSSQMTNPSWR